MSTENFRKESPFFSVIVPVYNVKDYLSRCVDSILNQDFMSYEILLVDDGSTDGSNFLCDEYSLNERVRVIHKENGGLASARNAGMDVMSGKYVLFVDSDDWIDQSTLTILYQSIQKYQNKEEKIDLVKYNYFRHDGVMKICKSCAKSGYYDKNEIDKLISLALCDTGRYCLSACMHAYRVELIIRNKIRFVSEREVGSEDYLFNIQLMFHIRNAIVIDNSLYHYDCRGGSLTQRYRVQLPQKYTSLFYKLIEYIKKIESYDLFISRVAYFYIWSLLYGTCLVNEYCITNNHPLAEGRKNVKEYLRYRELRFAVKMSCKDNLTIGKKIQLLAMLVDFEPLFYYLFYVKANR